MHTKVSSSYIPSLTSSRTTMVPPQQALYTDLTSKPIFSKSHRQGYILYFWAPWHESSAPGGATHSLFETLAASIVPSSSSSIYCARIEAERYPSLCLEYNVSVVPTFVFVCSDEQRPIQKWEGVLDMTVDTQSVLALTQAAQDLCDWTLVPITTAVDTATELPTTESSSQWTTTGEMKLQRLLQQSVSSPIVLFVKGTPTHPQSTESQKLIALVQRSKIDFQSFDLLSDDLVYQALLQQGHPTDTFIYIHGKYIGGYDTLVQKIKDSSSSLIAKEEDYVVTCDVLGLASSFTPEISTKPSTVIPATTTTPLEERLQKLIHQSKVMVFMKGLPSAPKCGFSRTICQILDQTQVPYQAFDILQDETVRQGLKDYSNWPTYPQLYVDGELIGGLDIVKELDESGELQEVLKK